ncbi:hypothetical protein BDY21DRAFT_89399 [Lineolata rhizophorae]|uniref:SUZ domain-containing protein n=1 Tax=Lineolata rhizophorae TaxID=578093 RepID=A0A6A6PCB7_9PEZI|nr:hypothetical protein BDY21DRAFT_89399 [Lineolata rhizophorae]
MRRGGDGATPSGSNTAANSENPSKATSEVGGESGSDGGGGGQAAANSTEPKPAAGPITREEKEARYREARQRIFGTAEASESPKDGENTNANNNASEAKDVSRSSSTTGRKKNGPNSGAKKRNYNDDGFEARSQFNSFYPPGAMGPYAVQATYQSQTPDGVWYGGQYPGVAMSGVPPPHFPNMQYGNSMAPPMIGQDPSQQDYSQWQGQPYVEANGGYGGGQGFPGPANGYSTPNSYNPSAFQRGIPPQFQGPPANSSPRGAQAMAMKSSGTPGPAANQAQGHGSHQQHHTSGGEGAHQPWGQMPQYMGAGGPYPMDASGQQPQPWMHQTGGQQQPGGGQQPPNSFMPHQSAPPYLPPYGHQMPPHSHSTTPFAPNHKFRGPPTNPHHPLPGSYNRPQFNPQSQAFVPGGGPRSVSQPPHQPSSSPLAQPTMTAAASPYGLPAKPHVSSAPPLSNGAQQQRHQGMNGFAASGHRTPRMSPPHASYPVVSGGGAPGAVGPQPFATTGPARLLQPQQPQTMQQAQQHRKQSPLTHPLPAGPVVATSTASAPGGRGPTSGGGAGGNGRNASGGGTNSGRGTPLQKGGAALQQGQGPEQGLTPVVASSTAATPSSTSANSAASGTSNNNNPTAAPQQQQHHSSIAKWGTPSNLPPKPPPPVNSQLPPKFLPGMYPGGAKGPPGSFASAANAAAVAAAAAAVGGGAVPGVNSGNGGSSAGYGGQGVVGGKK